MQIKAKPLFTTVLLVVLVIVMALSGLNQAIVDSKQYVVKVGKSKISIDEYQEAYNAEKASIQTMLGSALSDEQLNSFGFHQTVLDKLVQSKLLENLAHEMNFEVGNESVKDILKNDPSFHDEKGHFNKEKLITALNNSNTTENEYIDALKEVITKQIALDPLKYIPGSYYHIAAKIYDKRFEKRSVDVAIFEPKMLDKNSQNVSTAELKKFYENNKNNFWSNEKRAAEYIVVNKNNIDSNIQLNEDEILNAVNQRDDRIDISYISLKTAREAQKTIDQIGKKTIQDFPEHKVAKNLHRDILPANLLDLFSLAANETSKPIEISNAWYIFQIDKKYNATTEEREEAEKEIRIELRNTQLNERLEEFINTLEEKLSSGMTTEEVVDTYNLTVHKTTLIDRKHNNKKLVTAIFNNNQKDNHSFTSFTDDEGIEEYYYVKVTEVQQPKPEEFEVCKEEVKKAWESDWVKNKLYELATAESSTLKNSTRQNIFRLQAAYTEAPEQNYPEDFIEQVFKLNPGELTLPTQYQGDKLIVGKLIASSPPIANITITREIEEEIRKVLVDANYNELKHYLQNKFPVIVKKKN